MISVKLWILLTVALLPIISSGGPYPNFRSEFDFVELKGVNEWWQTASFYQIYPRSFKDSDDDGIGDLKGITDNLEYLKEIGINATWLSPIFKSPMKDFGYDIADFYAIQPEYGTMEDFDALISKAKELGIKIILDFVPNHSSDQCEWFKKSIKKEGKYKDYYVWHPGYPDPKNPGKRLPPSNWISVFRKSAWEWNEERGEFYLHQFAIQQPDLNYRNKDVQEEMKNVLRFWLNKGAYGFRIDAVPHCFECQKGNDLFPNEPRNQHVTDPEDYGYLVHDCTVDQPETLQVLYDWRSVIDEFNKDGADARVLMTESWSPLEIVMKYYGDNGREGAQIPFNFQFITSLGKDSTADDFVRVIKTWMEEMPKGRTANWVMGNHDKSRVGTRFGVERIDLMSMVLQTLPGVGVTYQGEEIGMTDVWISWNDTVDPQACNTNPKIFENFSRDPERTPFQWNAEKNAGFSKADKTWLPVAKNYKEVNVDRQRGLPLSHLNIYKRLQHLRREKTLREGDLDVQGFNRNVFGILRSLRGEPSYLTVVNLSGENQTIDLTSKFENLPNTVEYVIVGKYSTHKIGDKTSAKEFTLQPNESVVLTTSSKLTSVGGYYFYASN